MSKMLKQLEKIYNYPVDIEFTANFNARGKYSNKSSAVQAVSDKRPL